MNAFQEFNFEDILRVGIALIITVSGLIAVVYSIWGGFLLILSGGSEEKVKPAVNHIRHAAIGIVVLMFIVFFAPMCLKFFGFAFADEISVTRIFQTIQEVSDKIFGTNSSSDFSANPGTPATLPSNFSDL